MTVIVASHDMAFVRELSDETVFLYQGKIIESGDTQTIFHSPQTTLFKNFIGDH